MRGQDKAHKITTILNKDRNVRKPFLHATVNQKQTRKKKTQLYLSCQTCKIAVIYVSSLS